MVSPQANGRYRVLALDIDNTLVRFPHSVSPRVEQAVRAAVDAGVHACLQLLTDGVRVAEDQDALGHLEDVVVPALHLGDGAELVRGLLVGERGLQLGLPGGVRAELAFDEGGKALELLVGDEERRIQPGGKAQSFLAIDRIDDLVPTFVQGESEITPPIVRAVRDERGDASASGPSHPTGQDWQAPSDAPREEDLAAAES